MRVHHNKLETEPTLAVQPPLRIMVVYADTPSRNDVLLLSHRLLQKVGAEIDIEFTWWRFDFLADAHICRRATMMAKLSDIVIFSVHHQHELPSHVQAWIEQWVRQRTNSEGALGAMSGPPAGPNNRPSPVHLYLREVARCARMDFMTDIQTLPAKADYSTQAVHGQVLKGPLHN